MGTRCADHVTPLYPQKLALTSPTGGGRSVGIVRSRTKATEFSLEFSMYMYVCMYVYICLITALRMNFWREYLVLRSEKEQDAGDIA